MFRFTRPGVGLAACARARQDGSIRFGTTICCPSASRAARFRRWTSPSPVGPPAAFSASSIRAPTGGDRRPARSPRRSGERPAARPPGATARDWRSQLRRLLGRLLNDDARRLRPSHEQQRQAHDRATAGSGRQHGRWRPTHSRPRRPLTAPLLAAQVPRSDRDARRSPPDSTTSERSARAPHPSNDSWPDVRTVVPRAACSAAPRIGHAGCPWYTSAPYGMPDLTPCTFAARARSSHASLTRPSAPFCPSIDRLRADHGRPFQRCCSITRRATGRAASLPSAGSPLDEVCLRRTVLPQAVAGARRQPTVDEIARFWQARVAGPRCPRPPPTGCRRRDPGHPAPRAVPRHGRPTRAGSRHWSCNGRSATRRRCTTESARFSTGSGTSPRGRSIPRQLLAPITHGAYRSTLRALGLDFDLVNSYGGGEARLFAVMGEAFRDQFVGAGCARQADRGDRPPDP